MHDRGADRRVVVRARKTTSRRAETPRACRRCPLAWEWPLRPRASPSGETIRQTAATMQTRAPRTHICAAITTHSDHRPRHRRTNSRDGRRTTASPSANVRAKPATAWAMRAGSTRSARKTSPCKRSGWPAITNIAASTPSPTGAIASPPSATARYNAGAAAAASPANHRKNAPSRISTATRSRMRSTMIVANAAVADSRSCARQQIRAQHLAGARGQQERRRKSDHRRAEGYPEARVARAAAADTASARRGPNTSAGERAR